MKQVLGFPGPSDSCAKPACPKSPSKGAAIAEAALSRPTELWPIASSAPSVLFLDVLLVSKPLVPAGFQNDTPWSPLEGRVAKLNAKLSPDLRQQTLAALSQPTPLM